MSNRKHHLERDMEQERSAKKPRSNEWVQSSSIDPKENEDSEAKAPVTQDHIDECTKALFTLILILLFLFSAQVAG